MRNIISRMRHDKHATRAAVFFALLLLSVLQAAAQFGLGGGHGQIRDVRRGDGGFGDLGDIFGDFFGGGASSSSGRRRGPSKGQNVVSEIEISFEDAAFGCEREITFSRIETCSTCHGTGAKEGSKPETCPTCGGTGQVRSSQRTAFGIFQSTHACDNCRGTGKIIKTPCRNCNGKGYVRITKKLTVTIPAGIDNGEFLRVSGQGNEGRNGGPAGDLLIVVSVRPHEIFRREGTSVLCEAPITFTQAALGAELEIPTIDGKVKYTIPEGTQSGTTFRLKGKGIPGLNGRGRGDQYVTVHIETPRNLTREQKDALRKFSELLGERNYEENRSFFGKFKL